jgi:predicted ATPase
LRGLSLDEVGDFVRRLCHVPVDQEMVVSLQKVTDGNPFFLDEIIRLINADRDPVNAPRPLAAFTIPDSIRTAIRRRLRPLAEPIRSLLTLAAVIGRGSTALLQEASGFVASS